MIELTQPEIDKIEAAELISRTRLFSKSRKNWQGRKKPLALKETQENTKNEVAADSISRRMNREGKERLPEILEVAKEVDAIDEWIPIFLNGNFIESIDSTAGMYHSESCLMDELCQKMEMAQENAQNAQAVKSSN